MRRFIAALALALAASTLSVVTEVASAPPAAAVSGCRSKVRLQALNWSENVGYWAPGHMMQPEFFVDRLTVTAAYWWCPNRLRPAKIKVKWFNYCWSHLDGDAINFQGAMFNPFYYDQKKRTNPPETTVHDDGTVQNCRSYNVPWRSEMWQKLRHKPRLKVAAWILLYAQPNPSREFHWRGREWKPFRPKRDVVLGGWFR